MYKALSSVYEDRSTEVCKALRDRFERCCQHGRSIALFLGELATIQASLTANGQPYSEDDMLARISAGIDPAFQLQANILTLTPGMTFAIAGMKMVKYGMTKTRSSQDPVDTVPLGHLALHSTRSDAAPTPPLPRESSRSQRYKKCVNCGDFGHFAESCQKRECSACGGNHFYRDCFGSATSTAYCEDSQVAAAPAVVAYLDDVDTLSDDEAPIMAFTVAHDVALLPPSVLLPLYLDDTQQTDDLPISAFTAARGISIPNP